MRKFFVFMIFVLVFSRFSLAIEEDFYLNIKVPPEKLMPNTLNATLTENENMSFHVDVIPKFADGSGIVWECKPQIASVLYDGKNCEITALESGEAFLYAYASDGVRCKIKVKILPRKTKVAISSKSDSLKVGERAVFTAETEPQEIVEWKIEPRDAAYVSLRNNKCTIYAKSKGDIKISAIANDGEKDVKTISVVASDGMSLTLFCVLLFLGAIATLSVAVVFSIKLRRKG